ncbi:Tat pathway signal sequence domain protein [Streptomyces sp. NBC_00015]|uniref:Tat pathway signal sequence domain protein n=1 Tax=unclassified Streptomyces TaxID=2593676 RepID=UPI002253A410|nr:Tat pathway signal sequence domain protein [Streptomyces sp. NBC_00103]MCX5370644.1 Tat pathway signal sequence domain protein [Streptomyces sp. NBC_00103]
MSGVGPVEPGEGTHAWESPESVHAPAHASVRADAPGAPGADASTPAARLLRGLVRRHAAHRRAASAVLAAAVLLAGGGYLYATRPHDAEQAAPAPPFPSQVVDVSYLGEVAVPPGARPRTFAVAIVFGVESGPPVTVTRLAQPYLGLSLTSAPRAPFRTKAGSARKVVITMRVTECGKVPKNVGLPFVDVTLRNARAIQVHSFILGTRYAHDLSAALQVACSNESGNHQNA